MVTPTQAEVSFLIFQQPSTEQKLAIERTTGFPTTEKQLHFMVTTNYVFRTPDNISFQVLLG